MSSERKPKDEPQAGRRRLDQLVQSPIRGSWKAAGWFVLSAAQFGPPYEALLWPDRIIDLTIRGGVAFIAATFAVEALVKCIKLNPRVLGTGHLVAGTEEPVVGSQNQEK